MSKYISAEQLIDIITKCKDEPFKKSSIYAILTLMPSADVVEVVRCKDCKKHHNLKFPDCLWTDDDFFCADGERKETNG